MAAPGEHVCLIALAFLCILLNLSLTSADSDDKLRRIEIDVRPSGVVHKYEEKFGDFKCTFTFACQGGTNEKWDMILTESEDNLHYSCSVERPSGKSYLFFQSFEMQIEGARIVEAAAFADLANPLKGHEYDIDYDNGKVSHLKGFQSSLAKLEIFAMKGHEEL